MASGKKKEQKTGTPSIKNRKAWHEFSIEDSFEAGLVLTGTEVKSLRNGNASFGDAFAYLKSGEVWLKDLYIKPFEQGSYNNHDPRRERKLLLKRDEIRKLDRAVNQKGVTLVPLKLYFTRGLAKIQLGLAKGKKKYDKRASIAEKDVKRDLDRELKKARMG
ncbi:SsrA-binding protein SmpB [Natronogracilivirga saccharolytica]|uniref:SsrA-binding protein n=1 Tax=Natronogracilivirga saccharolytica TaxID=2812953 RepID=A0A8J7UX24_9BACT|nr:SsrA-binding protein SmpB [Natronogracilivirga saccharolytica]